MVDNIYYIVLARDSDGDQLKKQFREEFQTKNKDIEVNIFDRETAIRTLKIKQSFNEPRMIKLILKSVPKNSLIFCDEVHMKIDPTQKKKDYDWTGVSNFREQENVWLLLSFKPLAERVAKKETLVNIKWPEEAKVVTLTKSFRQSVTLFKTLQRFHRLGVRVLNAKVSSVDVVQGPKPEVFFYDGEVTDDMKTFVHYQLKKYSPDEVKILFSKNKSNDAQRLFKNSRFSPSLSFWTSFTGCEAPVVVMFFSVDDRNWEFMEMASRAQFKVY